MREPDGSGGHEQSFANVLDNLGNVPLQSSGHRENFQESSVEQLVIPWLSTSRLPAESDTPRFGATEWDAPEWNAAEWNTAESESAESDAAEWWPRGWGAAVPKEWDERAEFPSAVRPYTWTRGRTRPVYDLAVETLVSTTEQGCDTAALTSVEHHAVAALCRSPRSVAEVAALLSLPLGVARVLLGDMADIGLVVVHRTASNSGDLPEFGFMERVLSGLRRL